MEGDIHPLTEGTSVSFCDDADVDPPCRQQPLGFPRTYFLARLKGKAVSGDVHVKKKKKNSVGVSPHVRLINPVCSAAQVFANH